MSERCDGRGVNARSASDGWQGRGRRRGRQATWKDLPAFPSEPRFMDHAFPSLVASQPCVQAINYILPRPRFQFRIKAKQHEGRHNPITIYHLGRSLKSKLSVSAAKKSELEEQRASACQWAHSNLTPMIPASEAAGLLGSQPCVQRVTTLLFAHFQRKQGAYAHIVPSRHWQADQHS